MVLVRSLTAEDVPSFMAWRGGDAYMAEIARGHLADHDEGRRILFVAVDGSAVIGTLQLVLRRDDPALADGQTCAYLEALDVREPYRRRGVATRLVESAGVAAASRGFRRLTVEVEPDNAPSLGLFERLGFSCFKRGTWVWRGQAYPTLCLERALPV